MSPEAQRIAIAEVCGWKQIDPRRWGGYTDTWQSLCSPSDVVGAPAKYCGYIPDFLSDLNAMHEAEKVLGRVRRVQYYNYLNDVIRHHSPVNDVDEFDRIHATVAQRAEAFLKTIGKWVETTPNKD